MARLFGEALKREPTGEEGSAPAPAPEIGGSAATAGNGSLPIGRIDSRADAFKALDRVCEFLERSEPTNPAPLLIRRAQRLMTMPFVDIMREIAPEGIESLNKIAGLVQSEQ